MAKSGQNVYDELKRRGALADATPDAQHALSDPEKHPVTCYVGFDPSSASLHIGNLIPLVGMMRMQRAGHKTIALIGTGTGMIGDPSGRTEERQLLEQDAVEANADAIQKQIKNLLGNVEGKHPVKVMRNGDWLAGLNLIEFLRDTGKHFSVGRMMKRDAIRERLEREEGLSFTEFSYQLIQAYDFWHLHDTEGCTMQMGGSDQWGNIVSGVDLIRRMRGEAAHGLTYPLITGADGVKFGKTMGDAPTLDPAVTSPYRLFQFFWNVADADVIRYLKLFTFIDGKDMAVLEEAVEREPGERDAQRALAIEIVKMVHGEDGLRRADNVRTALFNDNLSMLSEDDLKDLFADAPTGHIERSRIESEDLTVEDLIMAQDGWPTKAKEIQKGVNIEVARQRGEKERIFKSRGDLKRVAEQGGLYFNGAQIKNPADHFVYDRDILAGGVIVVRRGKKDYYLIKVE